MKGKAKENEIVIEFPDEELLPDEILQEEDEIEDRPEIDNSENVSRSNLASNQLSNEKSEKSVNEFLDEEYLKEVEDAKRLVSDVNNQLSKETIDLEDIKMPVQTTDGMDPDSIKNIVYTGESNITYYLENRYHLSLPIPVYLSQDGGKVIVDIVVNQQGQVTRADPRKSNEVVDDQIYIYAKTAALRTIFNEAPNAPASQKGSIHYIFVAQ